MNHGIRTKDLLIIKAILISVCRDIEKVALFGSRATGRFNQTSDIDLVLYGDISEHASNRLYTCFHESMIAHEVDLVTYQDIRYPPLKRHIDAVAKVLFTRASLYEE